MAYDDRDRGHHNFGRDTTVYQHQHGFEGRKQKRPTTDYGTSMVQWIRYRRRGRARIEQERPSPSYMIDILPPPSRVAQPANSIPSKHMHSSLNKIKHPINVVKWNPEGRRLLTGSSSGEFTLWNGMGFNFETIMSAHESAIRAVKWSHSDDWLISCDQNGVVKYWQPNFNNVKAIQAHDHPVRDLAFAPTDVKYVTASDDSTIKLWDFSSGTEEDTFRGHGWDVKTVDWHPTKGLIASGSRDHLIKLWDPRNAKCLTNLHGHKNTISKVLFDPLRGNLLATCARDTTARIFDLRMMRDVLLLKGHEKDIMTLTWHPIHHSLLTTAGGDGCMQHYLLDEPNLPPQSNGDPAPMTRSPYETSDPHNAPAQTIYPAHRIPFAHESAIWSLDWHPLGHILASGSNDRVTRFWSRARPGETECFHDRYHVGDAAAKAHGAWSSTKSRHFQRDEDEGEEDEEALVDQKMPAQRTVPGLPGIAAAATNGADGSSTGGAQPGIPLLPGMSQLGPGSGIDGGGIPPPPQLPPGFDPAKLRDPAELQKLFGGRVPPGFPPPVPPGFNPQGMPGLGGQPPQSFTPPVGGAGGQGGRRRAPLPSQEDSLRQQQQMGNYQRIR